MLAATDNPAERKIGDYFKKEKRKYMILYLFLIGFFLVVFFGVRVILYLHEFKKDFEALKKRWVNPHTEGDVPWYVFATYHAIMGYQEDYLDCMRTNIRRIAEKLEVKTRLSPRCSDIEELDVWDTGFPEKICEALDAAKVKNTKQLLKMNENQVLQIKGINKESLSLIKDILAEYGYRLACQNDLSTSIESLNLSVRTTNTLKNANIRTIGDVLNLKKNDIKNIRNIGKNSIVEIEKKLRQKGFKFN